MTISKLLFAALLTLSACDGEDAGSDAPSAGSYPRAVSIEYRVKSNTGLTAATVTYTNETGGRSTEDVSLPFAKTVARTVKQYDGIGLSATATRAGSLGMEILVDGASVDAKTESGTPVVSGTSLYLFP